MLDTPLRIITIYRSFRPPDGRSPMDFFKDQLAAMQQNCTKNTIILGDFNLDAKMQYRLDYPHKHLYACLDEFTTEFNFEQLIDFPTWSRSINNVKKESTLDHIYVNNTPIVSKCLFETPLFGNHVIVIIELLNNKPDPSTFVCRDWRNYDPSKFINILNVCELINVNDSVQQYWNTLENVLINAADQVAPLIYIKDNSFSKLSIPRPIKTKINKRNKLLERNKLKNCPEMSKAIKKLNKEIKKHFFEAKKNILRKNIYENSTNGIWQAVKSAKNQSNNNIPQNLTVGGVDVNPVDVADSFAGFFHDKVEYFKNNITVNPHAYNGKNKLIVANRPFMTESDIRECLATLKPKKCKRI